MNLTQGLNLNGFFTRPKGTLLTRALSAIKRNNGSAWWVPDDYGLTLGADRFVNFNAATGYVVSGGALVCNAGAYSTSNVTLSGAWVAGTAYRVTATVSAYTSGSFYLQVGGSGATQYTTPVTAAGTYTSLLVANSAQIFANIQAIASGFVGTISSLKIEPITSSNIHTDSTGTTPVTAVGDLVGLLTDRAGSVGPEMFGGFTGGTTNTGSTIVNGDVVMVAAPGGYAVFIDGKPFQSNKTYRFDVTYSGVTGSCVVLFQGGTASQLMYGTGSSSYTVNAGTVTSARVQVNNNSGGPVNGTVSLRVRELTGNHATQATTASKPAIARVPKRLGPELVTNGDFSGGNTGWTLANGATISAGQLNLPGANATAISTAPNCVSGKSYRFQFDYVSGTGAQYINVQAGSASFGVATTTTARRYSVVVNSTVADAIKIWQDGGAAGSAVIDNISVREVLEWSNVLDFDGSNDLLTLGSGAILQQGSDHWVCAGFVLDAVGAEQAIYGSANTGGASSVVAYLAVAPSGKLQGSWVSDTSQVVILESVATLTTGQPYVASISKTGSTFSLYLNGVLADSETTTLGATTVNAAAIGALARSTVGYYLNGKCSVALAQTTLTDADRRTIERYMAQQIGATYVG